MLRKRKYWICVISRLQRQSKGWLRLLNMSFQHGWIAKTSLCGHLKKQSLPFVGGYKALISYWIIPKGAREKTDFDWKYLHMPGIFKESWMLPVLKYCWFVMTAANYIAFYSFRPTAMVLRHHWQDTFWEEIKKRGGGVYKKTHFYE